LMQQRKWNFPKSNSFIHSFTDLYSNNSMRYFVHLL
jgi:hypothetical protein